MTTTRPMPPFRAAVFDMDGLLLDSERPVRDAWLQSAAEHQVALSVADYLTVVGRNERDSRVRLLELFGDDAELLGAVRRRADGLLAERYGTAPFPVKPGAQRLLQVLTDAKIPCAVASSTARDEVHRRLELAGLRRHFAVICGGDEVAHGKPAPDLYQLAIRRLDADAARSVAFEDSNYGARAALAAGLAVVVVPDLKPPEPAWQAHCLATLESLDDAYRQRATWFGIVEQA